MSRPCDLLQPFADGELTYPERPAFQRHLARCRACQDELASVMMLDALATSFFDEHAALPRWALPPLVRAPARE